MKIVRVMERDICNRPVIVAVGAEGIPIEVVAERGTLEWRPLYALRNRTERVELIPDFCLHPESISALEAAT